MTDVLAASAARKERHHELQEKRLDAIVDLELLSTRTMNAVLNDEVLMGILARCGIYRLNNHSRPALIAFLQTVQQSVAGTAIDFSKARLSESRAEKLSAIRMTGQDVRNAFEVHGIPLPIELLGGVGVKGASEEACEEEGDKAADAMDVEEAE